MVELAIICGIAALIIFIRWQNNGLMVTQIEFVSEKLPSDFDGFCILHISDLHNKSFGKTQRKLLEAINTVSPDMIAVTGDMIDKRRGGMSTALYLATHSVRQAPVCYVPGNHEHTSGIYQKLRRQLSACGVKVIDDRCIQIRKNAQHISVIGIKDREFFKNEKMYARKLEELSQQQGFKLLLSHRPEKFKLYQKMGFDLTLTGHAHGGQWRLPVIGGLYAPHQGVFPKYTNGLHQQNGTGMVISRGLGNSLFPLRLFNRPELVVVTLRQAKR